MKKSRKSKIVLLSVLGLATVSLATVGFASWVISGVTPATKQNIAVSAGTVTDNTLKAEILSGADLTVAFDNVKVEGGIGGTPAEKLEFGFSVKVTGTETVISGIKFTFTLDSNFKALFTAGYLQFITNKSPDLVNEFIMTKGPTCSFADSSVNFADTDKSSATYAYADGAGTFTCRFAFKWGSKFDNVNPSECYAKKSTEEKATVISNLKAFDDAAKLITTSPWMSVVVTPVAAAAQS